MTGLSLLHPPRVRPQPPSRIPPPDFRGPCRGPQRRTWQTPATPIGQRALAPRTRRPLWLPHPLALAVEAEGQTDEYKPRLAVPLYGPIGPLGNAAPHATRIRCHARQLRPHGFTSSPTTGASLHALPRLLRRWARSSQRPRDPTWAAGHSLTSAFA